MSRLGVRSARRLVAVLCAAVSLGAGLAPSGAQAQEAPVGCGYGASGPYAPNLCWFDMSAYNDTKARSEEGQQMSVTLPGGYVVKFTLTSRPVTGHTWRGVESRAAPVETRFAFGKGGYVGVPGKPVLYSQGPNGANGVELKLSNISVVDAGNRPVTGYKFVVADAENNINGENFTWTSDKSLSLLGVLNEKSPAGCHNAMTGLGTTTVTCTGQGSEPGPPDPRYDAVVVGADTPSRIALSMTTFARSGVAFAIMTSKVQVIKRVVGRVKSSDSFDVKAESPEGSTLATATTGSANTATTGELTVLPLSGGASYTLAEEPTPTSGTRQSDYARSWSCTNNGVAEPSLPAGSGPSVSVSPQAGDFIACTVTNTQQPADLSVHKTVSSETAAEGDTLTYTMQVKNHGPSAADATLLKDTLPAGVRYLSDDARCAVAGQAVECALGTLSNEESRSVQIEVEVLASAAGHLLTNVATVSGLQPDVEPTNDESSAQTAVEPFADLALTKSVAPSVIKLPGEQVVYTLVVTNKGENEALSTVLTDALPEGITYVGDDAGCDSSAEPTITCNLGTLVKGQEKTVEITGRVDASAVGSVVRNTARVGEAGFDPDQSDNEASATLEVEPLSDLAVTKTTVVGGVRPGDDITYEIKAENKGPTPDTGVEVTDTLPAGLELVSADSGCVSEAPTVKCALGNLANGQSTTITLVARVTATSGSIANTATITGAIEDAEAANNSSTATTPIEPTSDLLIRKSASVGTVKPGETLTYTLEVENEGPVASGSATVTDNLPPGLNYVSDDGECTVTGGGSLSCEVGPLANGATRTIHVLTAVAASASGSIANTADVSGPNFDPELGNDQAVVLTPVEQVADLAIVKSAPAKARPGDEITYDLEVENKGPSTSSTVTVTDPLPAGVKFVSDDAGCDTAALPTIKCEVGPLANGATRAVHIVAEVLATTGSVSNTAGVAGSLPDPQQANDSSTATTTIEEVSDLILHKSAGAASVKAGGRLTYTLEVENQGPSDSPTETIVDSLPAGLTYVSDTGRCDTSALPKVECALGPLVAHGAASVEVVTEVKAGATGQIQNTATVKGPNFDPALSDDNSTATTPITPSAADSDPPTTAPPASSRPPAHHKKPKPGPKPHSGKPNLVLHKTASTSFARPSAVVGYTITVWNKGDGDAHGVKVCDEPPAGLTILRSEPAAVGRGEACWRRQVLAAGAKRVFRVTAQIATTLRGAVERNRASVSAANVKGVRTASAGVRVKPLPNRACGSALARPFGFGDSGAVGIAQRC